MSEHNDITHLLDNYALGKLAEEEKTALDARLKDSKDLQDALQLELLLNEAVVIAAEDVLRNEINSEFNQYKKIRKYRFGGLIGLISITALLAITFSANPSRKKINLPTAPETKKTTAPKTTNTSTPTTVTESKHLASVQAAHSTPETVLPLLDSNEVHSHLTEPETVTTENSNPEATPEIAATPLPKEDAPSLTDKTSSGKINCQEVTIQLQNQLSPSCELEPTGTISLSASGGKQPYSYSIYNNEYEIQAVFTSLDQGAYTVQAKDSEGCESKAVEVYLESKPCTSIPKAFNPNDEAWKYPESETVLTLKIMNPARQIVFEMTDSELSWNGKDFNGNDLPVDSYLYLIYKDGQLIDKDYVTLARQ